MSNKYLIFLGCAIPYRETSYEMSARKVIAKLGVKLVEMPEFNCCMLILAARNLALAEQQGFNIIALCPGCTSTLKKVNEILKEDKALKEQINSHLKESGLEFKGTVETKHLIRTAGIHQINVPFIVYNGLNVKRKTPT